MALVRFRSERCIDALAVQQELRKEFNALVEIEPSLPRDVYDTSEEISWLILASRLEGDSLFPVTRWPLPVYICRLKNGGKPKGYEVASENILILDYGKVQQSVV